MKVLLLGDSCEDEYIYGNCDRLSPEAPVPVMKLGRVETKSGMAGNVCLNLQAFNLNITFLTNTEKITKTRFIDEGSNYQILRVDNEERVKPLLVPVSTNSFDAVVISDYDKGFVTLETIDHLASRNPDIKIFVDTKKKKLPTKLSLIHI